MGSDYEFSEESDQQDNVIDSDLLGALEKQYEKLLEKKRLDTCQKDFISLSTSVSGDNETQKAHDFDENRFEENPGYLLETRREKVERYIRKRKSRNWNKKISYKCRKEVADARLRVKGRFITRTQANKLLGMNTFGLSVDLIRTLL